MESKIEDLKEKTPCGCNVRYSVNEYDLVTYCSPIICKLSVKNCKGCSWVNFCNDFQEFKDMILK